MMRSKPMVLLLLAMLPVLFGAVPLVRAGECEVRYLSQENIYLDAGSLAGIVEGDTLRLTHSGKSVAQLLVLFTAEHSAVCLALPGGATPRIGDSVHITTSSPAAGPASDKSSPTSTPRKRVSAAPARNGGGPPPLFQFGGSIALSWDHSRDEGNEGAGSDRLNARLRLDGSRGGTMPLRFRFRGRALNTRRGMDEWRDAQERRLQIYSCVLESGKEDGATRLAIGRLSGGRSGARGGLDGLRLDREVRHGLRLGLFLGGMPDWSEARISSHGARYGIYFGARDENRRLDMELVREDEAGILSREYLALASQWRRGSWTIRHRMTMDWNRDWRRERSRAALTMSEGVLHARFDKGGAFKLGLRINGRESPISGDYRSLPDSLFRAARSRGAQMNVGYRADRDLNLRLRAGFRHRDSGDAETFSYGVGIRRRHLLGSALDVDLNFAGFESSGTTGLHPALNLDYPLGRRHELGLGAGAYLYRPAAGEPRSNRWIRLRGHWRLPGAVWLAGEAERDWGEDLTGSRFHLSLGWRF